MAVTAAVVDEFGRTIASGGVVLFPSDTVYGLACDPESETAPGLINQLKGRPADQPSAVMFFNLDVALDELQDLKSDLRGVIEQLLPGPLTLILPNPARRFIPACGGALEKFGLRVPGLSEALAPLAKLVVPIMQTSANRSGGADSARFDDIDPAILRGVDLAIDGGDLPGTPSTVVDLSKYSNASPDWRFLRVTDTRSLEIVEQTLGPPTK